MNKEVHFFAFDERFCGRVPAGVTRRVAVDPNKVTCPHCKGQDTFVLSERGQQTLRELGYA